MSTVAVTGGTGFAGSQMIERLAGAGHALRCLARPRAGRRLESRAGVEWISGTVTSPADLEELVKGAETVIHSAGLTRALGPDGFHETNTAATVMLVDAARRAGVNTFIFISSLAASRPGVSPYAWSKALAEQAAKTIAGDMQLIILRPPAILGPGDSATRDVIALLRRGWLVCPGGADGASFSWIDVDDMARYVAGLVASPPEARRMTIAPCSGQDITWREVAAAGEQALGRKIRCVGIPRYMVRTAGALAGLTAQLTRKPLILSQGKVAEILQHEWHAGTLVGASAPLHQTLSRCFLETRGGKQASEEAV